MYFSYILIGQNMSKQNIILAYFHVYKEVKVFTYFQYFLSKPSIKHYLEPKFFYNLLLKATEFNIIITNAYELL